MCRLDHSRIHFCPSSGFRGLKAPYTPKHFAEPEHSRDNRGGGLLAVDDKKTSGAGRFQNGQSSRKVVLRYSNGREEKITAKAVIGPRFARNDNVAFLQ